MQAIIFIGIQASGKSSFYKEQFFKTHIRINLDMLRTRHREDILLRACLDAKQPFVVDNMNPTIEARAGYIAAAKSAQFSVVGYYFRSNAQDCIRRNEGRPEMERVPLKAIWGTYKRLQLPAYAEGFDKLFYVQIEESGAFSVQEWADEFR